MRRPRPRSLPALVAAALPVVAAGLGAAAAGADGAVAVVAGVAALIVAAAIGWWIHLQLRQADDSVDELIEEGEALSRALEEGQARLTDALAALASVLGATHDRGSILEVLAETQALLTDAEAVVFWVPDGRRLVPRLRRGLVEGLADDSIHVDSAVAQAAGSGVTTTGTPAPGEPRHPLVTAMPMNNGGRLFGVLAIYGHRELERQVRITAELLVAQAEVALSNTYLHEEARALAITDGLTGLWNRREFDLRLALEIDRSSRFADPFAVLLADLDHFKRVNDDHGHQTGDAVLIETSQRLVDTTRDVDVVARYGGEEFALLLPHTDLRGAHELAEKIRLAIAATPFGHDEVELPITISIGVAGFPDHARTPRDLVAAADEALYVAKETRNAVSVAVASPSDEAGTSTETAPDATGSGPTEATGPGTTTVV